MRDYPLLDLDSTWHDIQRTLAEMTMIVGSLQSVHEYQWPALQMLEDNLTALRALMADVLPVEIVQAIADEQADYDEQCDRAEAHAQNNYLA